MIYFGTTTQGDNREMVEARSFSSGKTPLISNELLRACPDTATLQFLLRRLNRSGCSPSHFCDYLR
ncbi:hypothetical protein AGR1A_Cc40097 [Agrobacterium fabacearum CFBP 5771]|nr:hypothetical protein AGR1A_Cc40097 [Agrobacterium fabacearum CFBP 5771]